MADIIKSLRKGPLPAVLKIYPERFYIHHFLVSDIIMIRKGRLP